MSFGKNVLLALCLIFFASAAFSLSVKTDKDSFLKGEEIGFVLECDAGLENVFSVSESAREIFEKKFDCPQTGFYATTYKTSFLDPAGKWSARISSLGNSSKKEIGVSDIRKAGFLVVRFLSPPKKEFFRSEKIAFSVEVLDKGENVEGAKVAFWDSEGKKHFFSEISQGKYSFDYRIPIDGKTGQWNAIVLAEKDTNGTMLGGKGLLAINVKNAPILLEVISPSTANFDFGKKVPFKVLAKYPDQSPATLAQVRARINGQEVFLIHETNGIFSGEVEARQSDFGSVEAAISAQDQYGNLGEKKFGLVVGCSITCLLENYGLLVFGFLALAFVGIKFFAKKVNAQSEIKRLEKEKQKALDSIKSLQENYFAKGNLNPDMYRRNLAENKAKALEIDEKIASLKKILDKK